jgi:HSP90 family molecular chaperone
VLDDPCRVTRSDGAHTFEITTASKIYHLMADSQSLMEEWVRVLQNVVQRNALKLLLSREDLKPTLQVSRIVGGLKAAFCL